MAVFPDIDQNHRRRAIPGDYQGIPTNVAVQRHRRGNPRPFTVETDDDGFVLVTSRGSFVHGPQTYVFTYTRRM